VAFPVPLLIRLPTAAALALFAGRANVRWLVPIAAFLGLAIIWRPHFVILLGAVTLLARTDRWRRWWSSYSDRRVVDRVALA
jgi:hypothetical protein